MVHRPRCQLQTTKHLEDNIKETIGDLEFCNDFLDRKPKSWTMNEKIGNWTSMKLKVSALWKTLLWVWKDDPEIGENTLKHISDKGLLQNI